MSAILMGNAPVTTTGVDLFTFVTIVALPVVRVAIFPTIPVIPASILTAKRNRKAWSLDPHTPKINVDVSCVTQQREAEKHYGNNSIFHVLPFMGVRGV